MRLLGYDFKVEKAAALPAPTNMQPGSTSFYSSWLWPTVREPYPGAWQRNQEVRADALVAYHAVYSCITLIASDVAKCRIKLMAKSDSGIWTEVQSNAFSPVLAKPNDYQTRIQFMESWIVSKLVNGNAYILKARDERSVVVAMYVLDPTKCKPAVASDGSVFYDLAPDNLSGVEGDTPIRVPASEIIHDMTTLRYHPLCGIPPMIAAFLPASAGLTMMRTSDSFFQNESKPGGILSSDRKISEETANRLKDAWQDNYSGVNRGKIAVLGDGLKFQPTVVTQRDAQFIEQLGITGKMVCSAFNVPAWKVGVGEAPSYNNIEALNQSYYSDCLQKYFESAEALLDEGLGLKASQSPHYGVEFDLDDLLRMDTATKVKTTTDAIIGGLMKPNEGRKKFDLPPVPGGDEVFMQRQNASLEDLVKQGVALASPTPPVDPELPADEPAEDVDRALVSNFAKAAIYGRKAS